MSNIEVTLEAWVAEISNRLKAREREILSQFQREWLEGHRQNPLLFPLSQATEVWQDNFDWYVTLERFGAPAESRAAEIKPRPALKTVPGKEPAKTVIFDAAPPKDLETVVMDSPALVTSAFDQQKEHASPTDECRTILVDDDDEESELRDLGTLIAEHKQRGIQEHARKKEPVRTGPAAEGTATRESTPAQPSEIKGTVTIEPETAADGLDDLGTLVAEHARVAEKTKSSPPAHKPKVTPQPAKPKPSPQPEAAAKPKAEPSREEVTLDLDDLDTMEWQDK